MERRGVSGVTAAVVILLSITGPCFAERLSRKLQGAVKEQPGGNVGAAAVKKAGLAKELSNLYSSLDTLKVSDIQDVDFASTLLVLEKHELVLANWYKTHGGHKALLGLADDILQTRKNETEDLADFLHRADERNPFAIAVSHDTPLSALIPLKTQALPAVSISLGGVAGDPAGMQAAKVQVAVKDNVLAAAAHQSAVRDGYETASVRYQNRGLGRPAGSVLPGSVHGMPLAGDNDSDFATIMTIQHQGVVQAAREEINSGRDSSMQALAEAVLERANAELEILRGALKELMEARYGTAPRRQQASIAVPAAAPSV